MKAYQVFHHRYGGSKATSILKKNISLTCYSRTTQLTRGNPMLATIFGHRIDRHPMTSEDPEQKIPEETQKFHMVANPRFPGIVSIDSATIPPQRLIPSYMGMASSSMPNSSRRQFRLRGPHERQLQFGTHHRHQALAKALPCVGIVQKHQIYSLTCLIDLIKLL